MTRRTPDSVGVRKKQDPDIASSRYPRRGEDAPRLTTMNSAAVAAYKHIRCPSALISRDSKILVSQNAVY